MVLLRAWLPNAPASLRLPARGTEARDGGIIVTFIDDAQQALLRSPFLLRRPATSWYRGVSAW